MKDPLSRELALLGLDDTDRARLEAGAVITMDGLFISIRNGALNVSRERLGSEPPAGPKPDRAAAGKAEWRRRIINELLSGQVPVDEWLDAVPEQDLGQVIRQIEDVLYEERRESPQAYRENPLLGLLEQLIDDITADKDFREAYLG